MSCELTIFIEFLEGKTLKELIDKGYVCDEKAIKYFEQCVSALKITHEKKIVHSDIKPSKIFITSDGQSKHWILGIPGIPSNNETFTIHYLFTHDGCKVYRFNDCGQNIYFTNCNGEAIAVGDSTRIINRTQLNTKVPGG